MSEILDNILKIYDYIKDYPKYLVLLFINKINKSIDLLKNTIIKYKMINKMKNLTDSEKKYLSYFIQNELAKAYLHSNNISVNLLEKYNIIKLLDSDKDLYEISEQASKYLKNNPKLLHISIDRI